LQKKGRLEVKKLNKMFIFSKRKKRLEEMKNYSHMFQRRKKLEEEKKMFLSITK
jgi:hypothetical protein